MRLQDKIAIVVGAGQSPGEGLGDGPPTFTSVPDFAFQNRDIVEIIVELFNGTQPLLQSTGHCADSLSCPQLLRKPMQSPS